MCHVHVSIHCIVDFLLLFVTYFYLYSSIESFLPPPPGDPTDDQLSDEPIFDPEVVFR